MPERRIIIILILLLIGVSYWGYQWKIEDDKNAKMKFVFCGINQTCFYADEVQMMQNGFCVSGGKGMTCGSFTVKAQ